MADIAATLQRTLENYSRIWLALTEVIANPTPANVDLLVSQAQSLGVVSPKPTYGLDGESYDWAGYQKSLNEIMKGVRQQLIYAQGPFEVRSRCGF